MDDTLKVVINDPKDNSWPKNEFTKFKSFKNFAKTLCAKQHHFKEQQNCVT